MATSTVSDRADAERDVIGELLAWRTRAVPESAPLDAEDIARLVRACFDALGIDPEVGADFSVSTVHYYRRKHILDAPAGRTSAARYGIRHLWQAAGARLAGYLGLVTLAEARKVMRGADEGALVSFVAARVLDARARQTLRRISPLALAVDRAPVARARPLPGVLAEPSQAMPAVVIPLPDEAWCIVPSSHPAHHSASAARELVHALAAVLRVHIR
jgi:hypothetical protein